MVARAQRFWIRMPRGPRDRRARGRDQDRAGATEAAGGVPRGVMGASADKKAPAGAVGNRRGLGSFWNDSEPKEIWRADNHAFDCLRYAKGYTGQSMASAKRAKIMETPPMENRSRSDISCPLAAVTLVGAREGASS